MPKTMSSHDMLARLVGFDTVSHKSNLELIEFIRDYLDGYGVKSELIFDVSGTKANLCATIGPQDKPGVVLSGHTDVVPVEDQDWSHDPFDLVESNGKFFGRGTCDMKGFIAATLALVPEFVGMKLRRPIHFSFSYDEELGCLGVHDIIPHIEKFAAKPSLCIVGEPTGMKPITGHKGIWDYHCTVHGAECHSSLAPYGVNAVENAAEVIAYLKKMARRFAQEGPFDRSFDPPFTTVQTGTVRGGTATNIVPNKCDFEFEFRYIPGHAPEDILAEIREFIWKKLEPEMKAVDPRAGFDLREVVRVPAFDIDEEDAAVVLVKNLAESNSAARVSFGTEAGVFQDAGVPTVVCGPGSIEQAHKPDEFVAVEQMMRCESFLRRLTEHLRQAA